MRHKLLFVAALFVVGACAPQFGDDCSTATECSVGGDRYCDTSQPDGYCTQIACEPESCGGSGVCVRFKADTPRLASNWCMAECSNNGECRDKYVCRNADDLSTMLMSRVQVLDMDKSKQKFCVVRE